MNRIVMMVLAGLCAGGLTVSSLPAVAAEPAVPAGPVVAPPPPPIVDEKTAEKAGPNSADTAKPNQQANPIQGDPDLEPQVTLIEDNDETHEEVRVNGVIRYIKVTPKAGSVYYLVPVNDAAGLYVRRDSLDSGLRVPMWQLFSW